MPLACLVEPNWLKDKPNIHQLEWISWLEGFVLSLFT